MSDGICGPQLITYPDSLGGTIGDVLALMQSEFEGMFPSGVHVLPPFPSSGDRGFAPIRYDRIDERFGAVDDLRGLSDLGGLTLDVMVNHISAQSPQFQSFLREGRASEWADIFVTVDKVFPDGPPTSDQLQRTALRRPDGPFHQVATGRDGRLETVWATFADKTTGRCEQIDVDLASPLTRSLIGGWFKELAAMGATVMRLDAVGYVTKRAGTTSFMQEPEIWTHLADLSSMAGDVGTDVLPEVHHTRDAHHAIAERGYWSYDFVLPAIVLHSLYSASAVALADHLSQSPGRQVTTLDTHDGIPIMPDMTGVLQASDLRRVVDECVARGANTSHVFRPPSGGIDVHQINTTYRDVIDGDDAYLAARAIQLFARGMPQIYYVGLLGGHNDVELFTATADGRSLNRHNYSRAEIRHAIREPLVDVLFDLVRLRAEHPAFGGIATYAASGSELIASWVNGTNSATLTVDLADPVPRIEHT